VIKKPVEALKYHIEGDKQVSDLYKSSKGHAGATLEHVYHTSPERNSIHTQFPSLITRNQKNGRERESSTSKSDSKDR